MGSTARDVTNAQAPTAGPDMALPELERAFPKEGVTRFPVVDQDGRLGASCPLSTSCGFACQRRSPSGSQA